MRRALVLSVVLVSGCHQAAAPPAAGAAGNNTVKANKEMSDLLRKADTLAATNSTPPVAAPEPVSHQRAPSANPPVAPADSPHVTPAKPPTDVMRDQAAAAFADRLRALRRTAEAARLKKDRYQQICQGNASTKSECQLLTTDAADASNTIERELEDIEESGRRARIDAGTMHDLLARYGF